MNIFCSATWEEINLNLANRFIKYCCHQTWMPLPENLTVDWILNNQTLNERKQFMLDNKKHSTCNYCWSNEEQTGTSMRLLKNDPVLEQVIRQNPKHNYVRKIEIGLDNICNQSCIYCNETYSSLIAEEKGIIQKFSKASEHDINVIVDWLGTIDTNKYQPLVIKFLGGEPTASKNYFNFLDRLIEVCSEKYFNIFTVTNCNSTDKSLEKMQSYFDHKTNWKWSFGISNESTGSISENVRHNGDWNNFDKCLKFYAYNPQVFFITMTMSPNIFTIKDMPKYVQYVDNIFKKSKKNYGYTYNWVQFPTILNPANLPKEFKKYVIETKEIVNASTSNIHKPSFLNYLNQLEKLIGTKNLDNVELVKWLDGVNFYKGDLNTKLLLSQCEDT
jgi:organic radical activating enzyme